MLIAWVAVILVAAAIAFVNAGSATGWEDLVRFAVFALAAFALAGVGLAWLAARALMSTVAARTVTAVVAPPLVLVLGWLLRMT